MSVDFEKFVRLCQLENLIKGFFLCLFFQGCTHEVIPMPIPDRPIEAQWLKVDQNFALRGKNDEYLIHPFFDIPYELNNNSEIRYFVTTPKDGQFHYQLDLLSGSLYKLHDFCEREDVWENYSAKIIRPNFDIGMIPQVYDETGAPQRILIFKSDKTVGKFNYNISTYFEGKILGSVLIEQCRSFPCRSRDRWKTSQILVGVNNSDPEFSSLVSFADLKSKIDWAYVKAFLANGFGTHQIGKKNYPAYRVIQELSREETMKNFGKRAKLIKLDEEKKFRDDCIQHYNKIWESIVRIRNLKFEQQYEFLKYFRKFYAKDSKQYFECQKLIRPANINVDPDRHWFFAFLSAFINLERGGLYYSCSERTWSFNPKIDDDHFYVDQGKELEKCRPKEFEQSFDQAINGMGLLKNQTGRGYRYIEYDTISGGSHQKIYSWITDNEGKATCDNERTNFDFFPQDVVWHPFKEDIEVKIIR